MRDIGKNIRDLRMRKNMTQDELAEKLFVTRQTISNYETGRSRPDIEMLMKISEVLEADIHQMLYGAAQAPETRNIRHLAIGSLLTVFAGLCAIVLASHASYIKSEYWFVGLTFLQFILVLPLFFLPLGWTLAHLTGMALKKTPLCQKWTAYVRLAILLALLFYLFSVLSFLIPQLIGEYRFFHATGDRSLADFTHIPAYAHFIFYDILWPYMFARHTPEVCAFTLPIGALLWLFGFPKSKKN